MNYTCRIARATIIVFVFSLMGAVLGYMLRLFIARNTAVEDFGLFYSVLAFFSFFWVMKDFGIGTALVKYVPEFEVNGRYNDIKRVIKASFLVQFAIGAFIGLALFLLSDYISIGFFHNEKASFLIKLFSIEIVLGVIFLKMLLQGLQKMVVFSLVETVRIITIFIFIFLFGGANIENIAISYFLASLAIQAFMVIYVARVVGGFRNSDPSSGNILKPLAVFGSFIFMGNVATFVIGYADTMVLTYFRSLYEVGLYQVSVSTSQMLLIFSSSFTAILFPVISEVWSKGRKSDISGYMGFMIKSIFLFMAFISLLFMAFPEIIINIFFGGNYLSSSLSLQILSFGMIFFSMNMVFSVILNAIGQPRKNTTAIIIISLYNLAANIMIIPVFGIEGAAVSTASSYIVGFVILYRYLGGHFRITIPLKEISAIFAASLLSMLIIYMTKNVLNMNIFTEAVISVTFAAAFYLSFFLKVRLFNSSDMRIVKSSGIMPERILRLLERYSR
ncbi:MAG: flippase [Candidatus Aenigmarchaeota archaeon]|nr:flippase [Candidatus Aenigmarchaeota archaeon]